jgi:NADH:ubiquinone oxidoreductase subunit 4 (subunit M)
MFLDFIFTFLITLILIICLIPKTETKILNLSALYGSSILLLVSTYFLIKMDLNNYYYQYITTYSIGSKTANILFSFGLDGISILFFFLTIFLFFLCVLFI